jgi:hypothetical protein
MYSDEWRIALRAEAAARNCASMADCLNILRRLPLADFAELMLSMPREELPGLSRLLPRMAPVEAQRKWTGFEGAVLPRQTVTFVRGLACTYAGRAGARWPMRGFSISGADTADTCAPWRTSPIQKICTAAIHGLYRWPDATRTVCSATLRRHSFCRSIFRFREHLISSTPSPFSRIFWHVLRVKPRCIARISKTGRRARHNDSPDRILDHCQRDGRGKMSA